MRFKTTFSIGALIFSASSLFAAEKPCCRPINSFEQGHELRQCQMAAAYNAPARIDVRGSWDLYLTASYIFWQPTEENLELGIANASPANALPINGNVAAINFKYKSGLKVSLGIFTDADNWDGLAEYTWLVGRDTTQVNGSLLPFWGHPANIPTDITSGKSLWRVRFDILDFNFGRSCYIGTLLTFRPFFGVRSAWIHQKYDVSYTPATSSTYQINNTTSSWSVGPETGLDMNWLLGAGCRLIGKAEADLVFTRYTLSVKEQDSTTPSGPLAVNLQEQELSYLRPHLDLEMGFGWGTYFSNHNYHIDLLAAYGFQVFWNQNMFRQFVDDVAVGKSYVPNGDLYVQGLTVTARFDF